MIQGMVNADGSPIVTLKVGGITWSALVDTGFNGELQLPQVLFQHVHARDEGLGTSVLANGETVTEEAYRIDFAFDGENVSAQATFEDADFILLDTGLLRGYHLEINFPARTVRLERVA